MIWSMWGSVLVAGTSGFMMETDQYWGEDWIKLVHHGAVNVSFLCVCLHICAVIIMSRITGRSYLRNMLPKRKNTKT